MSNILHGIFLLWITLPVSALAHEGSNYDSHMTGPHMMGQGWGLFFGPVIMVVIIAVAIFYFRRLGRSVNRPNSGSGLAILEERFAKGEIDEEEFEQRKRLLTSGNE